MPPAEPPGEALRGPAAEIVMFIYTPRLIERFGHRPLLLFALGVSVLRWLLTAWAAPSRAGCRAGGKRCTVRWVSASAMAVAWRGLVRADIPDAAPTAAVTRVGRDR